jgi:RNA polymerase sigma-70 factor (ECF subfamily)
MRCRPYPIRGSRGPPIRLQPSASGGDQSVPGQHMIAETGKFSSNRSNTYWGKANLKFNRQPRSEPQPKAPAEERRLLERLRRKKSSAFLDLYDRYQGVVFRFLLHMTGNETTAEELTQELFVSILTGIEKDGALSNFNTEKGCLEGYLIGFARNLARRSHFQGQRWTALDGVQELAYQPTLLEDLSSRSDVHRLRQAILSLPPAYREVVVLCGLEEKSYEQVARILDCPQGTVASRFNRGRLFLAKRLSNRGELSRECSVGSRKAHGGR